MKFVGVLIMACDSRNWYLRFVMKTWQAFKYNICISRGVSLFEKAYFVFKETKQFLWNFRRSFLKKRLNKKDTSFLGPAVIAPFP